MASPRRQQRSTRLFARVLGPYFTIVAVIVVARAPDMPRLLAEFTASAVWPWVTGAFILAGGLSIIAFHQIWRGPAAIVVSVMGWVLAARGIFLMALPNTFASAAERVIDTAVAWQAAFAVVALIGLYLTYTGWKPQPTGSPAGDIETDIDSAPTA